MGRVKLSKVVQFFMHVKNAVCWKTLYPNAFTHANYTGLNEHLVRTKDSLSLVKEQLGIGH